MKEVLVQQLLAARVQIDAALAVLMETDLEEIDDGECKHPADRRQNLSTMRGPKRWLCRDCGFEYREGGE